MARLFSRLSSRESSARRTSNFGWLSKISRRRGRQNSHPKPPKSTPIMWPCKPPKRSTWIPAHVRRSPNLWTLQINVSSMLLRKGYKHSWNLMHTSDSYNQNSTRNYSTRRPPHPPTPRRYRTFEVEVLNRWGRRRDFHSPNPEGKKRNKKQQKFDGISFLTHDCCVPFQGGTGNHWNTINQSITLTHSLTPLRHIEVRRTLVGPVASVVDRTSIMTTSIPYHSFLISSISNALWIRLLLCGYCSIHPIYYI